MSRILVLGYRPGLDDAIRRRGLTPFFVVERVKRQLAGREYARVGNLEDAQEVLRAVLARGLDDVCAVVTGHEEAVFTAAFLRSWMRLPGDRDYARTLRFRDKFLQKQGLPASVPRAACEYVAADSSYGAVAARLGEPFVVKPANGFGSARTRVVRTAEQFASYWEDGSAVSDVRAVAESFVGGDEIHVDGLWQDGRVVWSCLSCYAEPPIRWNDGGILADACISRHNQPELYAEADRLTEQALRGLRAPDTVFHLEAFRCPAGPLAGRLVFGECAIRIAGAMVPEVISLTYGVDLYDMVLSLALGEPVEPPVPSRPDFYYGYVCLRRVAGVELTEDDFRRAFPEVYEIDFPTAADAPTGVYGRVGHAYLRHEDSDRLQQVIADVVAFNETGAVRRPVLGGSRHD